MSGPVTIRVQEDDFDVAREIAGLTRDRTDIGAVVSFSGICRVCSMLRRASISTILSPERLRRRN